MTLRIKLLLVMIIRAETHKDCAFFCSRGGAEVILAFGRFPRLCWV